MNKYFSLNSLSFRSILKAIILILLLLISILFYQYARHLPKVKISPRVFTASPSLFISHDFDKDGFSERVNAFYDSSSHIGRIIVETHTAKIINEWHIPGFVRFGFAPYFRWISFGDINNDDYDDIIVFSQESDSLFLNVIDVKNSMNNTGQFLIKHSFLLRCPNYKDFNSWEIYLNQASVIDLNNDNQKELIFSLVSGLNRFPRGIYLYDFKQKKIIFRYGTNASLIHLDFFDLDGDNKKEIIASTYASENFPADSSQSDFYSWIFVFNDSLKTIFPPLRLYGPYSSFHAIGVKKGKQVYIVGFVSTTGKTDEPSKFMLITPSGNIVQTSEIHTAGKWCAKFFRVSNDSVRLYIYNQFNYLREYNIDFKLLRSKYLKNFEGSILNDLIIEDLNRNGKNEIIIESPLAISIFNRNFDLLGMYHFKSTISARSTMSIIENGASYNKSILLSSKKLNIILNLFFMSYFNNPAFLKILTIWIILALFLLIFYLKGEEWFIRWQLLSILQKRGEEGILILNEKGKIIFKNNAVDLHLTDTQNMKDSENYQTLFKNLPQFSDLIARAIKTREPVKMRIDLHDKSHLVSVIPITTVYNFLIGYFIKIYNSNDYCFDERTKIWTNTIKKLAHDIKTPLSNIELGIRTVKNSVMNSSVGEKDVLAEDLDVLNHEVRRITNVVRSFLKFVNLEKPHFQLVHIDEIIEKSIHNFHSYWESNFTIELDLSDSIPPFYLDPHQMELVFNNLIKNALDALREKGHIIIRTILIEDEISEDAQPLCEIEIADNGPGIEKEKQALIFQAEYTEKKDGSGMGLTIVKKIIEDHRGEIKVFSTPGLGTTFRILLPINLKTKDFN